MGDNKISDDVIRDVFLRNGFTIKEGQDDLKPYVYAAARDLIAHLQGEAVPVAHGWLVARPDVSPFFVPATHPHIIESFQTALAVECGTTVTPVYLHPQPAELSEVSGGHELARAVEKALGNRDGKRDAELDELLEMAMHELNAIDTSLPDEVSGDSGELVERQSAWNDSARLACLESWAREPGGLLLHAESGTGRRGLGLGENCGRRTLAQAIDSCATHAEKDSFAALAATGKQQVGENQIGDATNMVEEVQGVDLGKVRSSISAALGLCVICAGEDAYSRGEVRDFGIKMHGEFAKTLALIDGRDAGTGVGRG